MVKQWYVTLWQREIEGMKTGNQLLVYTAIKSYSANGKNEVDVSIRNIAGRSRLSVGEIHKTIPQLIALGFVQIVGQKTRRGGSVPIYKVFTSQTLNSTNYSQNEQLNNQSVHYSDLTVHSSGTKYKQDNKEKKENIFTKDMNNNTNPVHEVQKEILPTEYADEIFQDNNWPKERSFNR